MVGLKIGGTFTLEVGPTGKASVNTLTLPVNPSQSVALFFRTTITQTLSGIWVDRFGLGPQSIALQGDSAWDSPDGRFNGQHVDGNTAVRHLAMDILEYYATRQLSNPNSQTLTGINGATGETWELEPVGQPQLTRSVASPTTVSYGVSFTVLKDLTKGPVEKASDAVAPKFHSAAAIARLAQQSVTTAHQKALSQKQTPYLLREVQSGDTLYTMAQSYLPRQASKAQVESFVAQIVALNHLQNANLIFTGLWLKIPN